MISILKNPFYAGVYAYGKSEKRPLIVEGRARKSYGHGKPIGTWEVMLEEHHEGTIGWPEYERKPEAAGQQHLWLARRRQVQPGRRQRCCRECQPAGGAAAVSPSPIRATHRAVRCIAATSRTL